MKKTLLTTIFILHIFALYSQPSTINKPKLVIFISIDGLKKEHINQLYPKFKEGGFRRIIEQGAYIPNVVFNYISKSSVTDLASILTASTPSANGIVADRIYSVNDNKFLSIVEDNRYDGISSSSGRSPKNLQATTFTDILKIYYPDSKVFSIGLTPEMAIIMGGHTADGAIWIDQDVSVASTTFYKQMPFWAANYNYLSEINNCLVSAWSPMYSLHTYLFSPFNMDNGNFYVPSKNTSKAQRIKKFIYTPFANSIVAEMAQKAISDETLGQDASTDVLCLNFNVNTFFNSTSELNYAEKEDLILNLDRELEFFFRFIDEKIKMSNTLIVLTGTQAEPVSQKSLTENKFSVGKFEGKRSIALLNSFLMAKYGQNKWILNYNQGNIYFNNKEIEIKNINREDFSNNVINFLSEMQGVNAVYTYNNLIQSFGDVSSSNVRLKNSLFKGRSGDVILTLNEGWIDVNADDEQSRTSSISIQQTPVVFYGLNIENKYITDKYFVTDIIPTICGIMQLPAPFSSIGGEIILERKKQ